MTRPCLRMILHLLQIFFTLGLTFIALVSLPWRRRLPPTAPHSLFHLPGLGGADSCRPALCSVYLYR